MGCTRAQLLALLIRLERDLTSVCQRDIDIETCNRILSPLRVLKSRVEELASEEAISQIF